MKYKILNHKKTVRPGSRWPPFLLNASPWHAINRCYNTTLRAIIPLPDPDAPPDSPSHLNAYPEFPARSTVMALYPDTSCFYRAEVIASPKEMQVTGRVSTIESLWGRFRVRWHLPLFIFRTPQLGRARHTNWSLRMMTTRSIQCLRSG